MGTLNFLLVAQPRHVDPSPPSADTDITPATEAAARRASSVKVNMSNKSRGLYTKNPAGHNSQEAHHKTQPLLTWTIPPPPSRSEVDCGVFEECKRAESVANCLTPPPSVEYFLYFWSPQLAARPTDLLGVLFHVCTSVRIGELFPLSANLKFVVNVRRN